MKITFKARPRSGGLASVGEGPRGWDIRLDGKEVGSVYAAGGGAFTGPMKGWYFVFGLDEKLGIPYINNCNKPQKDADVVKKQAKEYLMKVLVKK
jgi:hypothetical protein